MRDANGNRYAPYAAQIDGDWWAKMFDFETEKIIPIADVTREGFENTRNNAIEYACGYVERTMEQEADNAK